jgi:hypothetical protein
MSSNLVVEGVLEDEVLLCLDFMKMVELADFVPLGDVAVDFDSKMMRTNLKLLKWDTNNMHQMLECVGGSNNKAISQLQEMLYIEGPK